MDTPIRIVIPSYNRAETLRDKTLSYLSSSNKEDFPIDVFVANEDEYLKYKNILDENTYTNIIIGEVGMMKIRNFICDYYPENTRIFEMDDDIKNMVQRKSDKELDTISNICDFIKLGFQLCLEKKSNIFSVYPVCNPKFMSNNIWIGQSYLMGGAFGIINRPSRYVTVNNKEDYERSLMYYKLDGRTIRFNYIGCNTKGYQGAGGMQSFRRDYDTILSDAKVVVEKYQPMCRLRLEKRSGKPEVWIKRIIHERIVTHSSNETESHLDL